METVARGTAPDLRIPARRCVIDGLLDPCTIVILGASGDLTARKIVPALFNLYRNQGLPRPCLIVGCARTPMSSETFRDRVGQGTADANGGESGPWSSFSRLLAYESIDYGDLSSFQALARSLRELDKTHGTAGNRIFGRSAFGLEGRTESAGFEAEEEVYPTAE